MIDAAAITISPLAKPIYSGDWHDKPLRWSVDGPNTEVQQFSTKKDATLYRRIRRQSASLLEASNRFVREAV